MMDDDAIISWNLVKQAVGFISASVMVFGGVFPYIPQYLQIKKTENQEGFSIYVCLVLIIANTLRIIFWFGHWFEIPLLLQSLLMNITMLVMIHCCVSCRNKTQLIAPTKERLFSDFDPKYFWEWSDFQSYIEFVLTFSTLGCLSMYILLDNQIFVESIGFAALLTEATLPAPQFYKNYTNKSTKGMSRSMVVMWLSGDAFKTGYFVVRNSPVQFVVCGILQITLDIAVLAQCFYYDRKKLFTN